MISIPRLIMSVHYFVPGRQTEAIDVRRAALYPLPMQSHIAANHFDFGETCRFLQSGLSPALTACRHRIYAVRDNHASKLKIFSRQRVSYGVAHWANCMVPCTQRLFNSVDTKIRSREPSCQLARYSGLPSAGKAAEDYEYRWSVCHASSSIGMPRSAMGQKRRSSRPLVTSGLPDRRTILQPAHGQSRGVEPWAGPIGYRPISMCAT